ncbi:hypothetical protein [Paraburkholderia terrae]
MRHGDRIVIDDVESQISTLTLLVALHLLVRAETGTWPMALQAVDVMRRWYRADTTVLDVIRRVTLSSRSLPLAIRLAEIHPRLLNDDAMRSVFLDEGPIDRSAVEYQLIRHACRNALYRNWPSGASG